MDYENLLKESFELLKLQSHAKNNAKRTKMLRYFYHEAINNFKDSDYIKDLINYILRSEDTQKYFFVAILRSEEEKVVNEEKDKRIKDLEYAIKTLNIENVKHINRRNDISLKKYIELFEQQNPEDSLKLSEEEIHIKNVLNDYPWKNLRKNIKKISKQNDVSRINNRKLIYHNEELKNYIYQGNLKEIRKAYLDGINIHANYEEYLNLAVEHNQKDIVDFLLTEGAKPSSKNIINAMKNKNHEIFKLLSINMEKIDEYDEKSMNNFVLRETKNIKRKEDALNLKNSLLELQEKHKEKLKNKNLLFLNISSPVIEKTVEENNIETIENTQEIIEEKKEKTKEIISPFNILFKTNFDIKSSPKKSVTNKIIKNDYLDDNQMQKKWDKELIMSFANDEKIPMFNLVKRFKENNAEEWIEFTKNRGILKRFPIAKIEKQWNLHPFRFICKYIPQMRDILLSENLTHIKDNIDEYTDIINKSQINTNFNDIKKSTIKSEHEEFKENKKVLSQIRLNKALSDYNKEEYSRHNWKKIK